MPIMIQRYDGSERGFDRTWDEFKPGWGDRTPDHGAYWLGNEILYQLTKTEKYTIRFLLQASNDTWFWAEYLNFSVDDENSNYAVNATIFSGDLDDPNTGGPAGITSGMMFSTRDKDHDHWTEGNCARKNKGGFWYDKCGYIFINSPHMKWKWPDDDEQPDAESDQDEDSVGELRLKFSRVYLFCKMQAKKSPRLGQACNLVRTSNDINNFHCLI